MVLKRSKLGANTGNTLRRNRAAASCKVSAFISKASSLPNVTRTSQLFDSPGKRVKEWVEDGGLRASPNIISHSLNKKRRWVLPRSIESQIKCAECTSNNTEDGELSRKRKRERRNRKKDTEADNRAKTTLSQGPGCWQLFERGEFFLVNRLIDSTGTNKRSKSQRSEICHYGTIQSEVYYHVDQPITSKHWPYYTDGSTFNRGVNFNMKKHNQKVKGIKRERYWDYKCQLDEGYQAVMEGDEDAYSGEEYSGYDISEDNTQLTGSVVLDLATLVDQASCAKETHVSSSIDKVDVQTPLRSTPVETMFTHEKGSFTIVDHPNHAIVSEAEPWEFVSVDDPGGDSRVAVPPDTSSESRTIDGDDEYSYHLWKSEIEPAALEQAYGHCYVEGKSNHRSFAIFKVNQNEKESVLRRAILFVSKESSISCHPEHEEFSVTICGQSSNSNMPTPRDGEVVYMKCLVNSALNDVLTTSSTRSQRKTLVERKTSIHTTYSDSILSTSSLSKIFDNILLEVHNHQQHSRLVEFNNSCNSAQYSPCRTEIIQPVCPVCYDDSSEASFSCLQECGHLICNVCWKHYVRSKVHDGHLPKCPESGCDVEMDLVTFMSFLDGEKCADFALKMCELRIQQNEGMKFCPTGNCQHYAEFAQDVSTKPEKKGLIDVPVVTCQCHSHWCFLCERQSHWPVSCEAAAAYDIFHDKEFGSLFDRKGQLYTTNIFVKRCPHCHVQIEKFHGCNHMSCRCGRAFCWFCLQPWNNHAVSSCKEKSAQEFVFSSLDDFGGTRDHRLFRRAVMYKYKSYDAQKVLNKLKISKQLRSLEFVAPADNSRLVVSKQALELVQDSYCLLEYIMVAKSSCTSRHVNSRLTRFESGLNTRLRLLEGLLNVKKVELVKVGEILKLMEFTQKHLEMLKGFGIRKM